MRIMYCDAYNSGFAKGYKKGKSEQSRKGHWIGSYCPYTCDQCGKTSDSMTPFCRYCGADMREEK